MIVTILTYALVFLIGTWVGAIATICVLALCRAAGDADERMGYK